MASATLSFSSSSSSSSLCAIAARLPHKQNPLSLSLSLSKPNFGSLKPTISPSFLSLERLCLTSQRPAFPLVAKFSESEAAVIESEAPEAVVHATTPSIKREEIFAVVMIGSRQYVVIPGRWIITQRLKGANVNDKFLAKQKLEASAS